MRFALRLEKQPAANQVGQGGMLPKQGPANAGSRMGEGQKPPGEGGRGGRRRSQGPLRKPGLGMMDFSLRALGRKQRFGFFC